MVEWLYFPKGSSAGFRVSEIPAGSRVAEAFEEQFGLRPDEVPAGFTPDQAAGLVSAKRAAELAAAAR